MAAQMLSTHVDTCIKCVGSKELNVTNNLFLKNNKYSQMLESFMSLYNTVRWL